MPAGCFTVAPFYEKLDAATFQQAAKTYLDTGNYVKVGLMPERKWRRLRLRRPGQRRSGDGASAASMIRTVAADSVRRGTWTPSAMSTAPLASARTRPSSARTT